MSSKDSVEVTKLLHMIGDLERLSDHAVSVSKAFAEMRIKNVSFSSAAEKELVTLMNAAEEILDISYQAFVENDFDAALKIEPLAQVIDALQTKIKRNHINRLKNNECTIELGFILSDVLADIERIADHCSNIGVCVIEIAHNSLDMHGYTRSLKSGNNKQYDEYFTEYTEKYAVE